MKKFLLFTSFFLCSIVVAGQQAIPLVFLEGDIGAGKSTFLKMLHDKLSEKQVVTTTEPCDQWQDIKKDDEQQEEGHNLLGAFYQDQAKHAYEFQLYAMMTRVKKQEEHAKPEASLQVMERSWFSDRYCFAQMLHEEGKLNEMQWAMYSNMWNYYAGNKKKPAAFIYLKTDPQVCYDRMKQRAREEEGVVPLAYLQQLHKRHEDWLIKKECDEKFADIPVLILDGTKNFKDNQEEQEKLVQQILDFLKNHEIIDLTK